MVVPLEQSRSKSHPLLAEGIYSPPEYQVSRLHPSHIAGSSVFNLIAMQPICIISLYDRRIRGTGLRLNNASSGWSHERPAWYNICPESSTMLVLPSLPCHSQIRWASAYGLKKRPTSIPLMFLHQCIQHSPLAGIHQNYWRSIRVKVL